MDDLAKLFIAVVIGSVAIVLLLSAAYWIAMYAATVGVGIFGLIAVKMKKPLANPHGPIAVPLTYAFLWSSVFTLALVIGSNELNQYLTRVPNPFLWLRWDALLFFLEATIVLFVSARGSRSGLAGSNLSLSASMVCLSASMIFTIGSALRPSLVLSQIAQQLAQEMWSTLAFPVLAVQVLGEGIGAAIQRVYAWLLATNGNLFKLSSALAKLLWIVSVFYAIKGWLRPTRAPAATRRPTLTPDERRNLALALALGCAMFAILGWIAVEVYNEEQHGASRSNVSPAIAGFALLGAYGALVWTLFRSRRELTGWS